MPMSLDPLTALVEDEFNQFKQIIIDNINSNIGLVDDLSLHIFKNGGKRVRPLLLMLTAKACGYSGNKHIMPAAAIEYFHTATLLHDDVLDESHIRRGADTANEIWGAKASILVGDILLTQSMNFMTYTDNMAMLKVLINAAHEITCGEVKQLAHAGKNRLSIEEYFDVIRAKTALLFSASSEIGAMAADCSDEVIAQMRDFGLYLGNAFQIIDDLLDYQADQATLGKEPGNDLKDGKITLPLICAMEAANLSQLEFLQNSIQQGAIETLEQVIAIMHEHNAFEKTRQIALQQADLAFSSLHCLPESNFKDALKTLVNFTLERCH